MIFATIKKVFFGQTEPQNHGKTHRNQNSNSILDDQSISGSICRFKRLSDLLKNLFRRRRIVEIPAGSKLYIYFYEQKFENLQKIDTLTIEFRNVSNIPKRNLLGNDPAHLEVYGPFEEIAECRITFDTTGTSGPTLSLFKIGLYEKQMLLHFGNGEPMCGNINLL